MGCGVMASMEADAEATAFRLVVAADGPPLAGNNMHKTACATPSRNPAAFGATIMTFLRANPYNIQKLVLTKFMVNVGL